jgi:Ni,Fe-hydrogenase III large subunit
VVKGARGTSTVVVGPVHAGIIEPGRFTFLTGGESVARLDAQLGFSRRGVERALQGSDARQAASRVARICGACSAARSWAYARALETLSGVRCTELGEIARVVVAELERAYNHVFDLASACSAAGYGKGQMTGLRIKESLHRINAMATGHRLLFDAIVPGGVRAGMLADAAIVRRSLLRVLDEFEAFAGDVFSNDSVKRRFEGAGAVSHVNAKRLNATGPALRASGATYDERTAHRYGAYEVFAVEPATNERGDVAARCRVKAEEFRRSLALCEKALELLGGLATEAPHPIAIGTGTAEGIVEGARGTEAVRVTGANDGTIARLEVFAASARNWPVVVEAMNGNIVPDFPLVNKSFNLCYACNDL